ncbi:hypothetical protein EIP91_003533 [Steccherinum ochraceum]|uniref:DASH complex subunit DAD2 n=1 Tax=Steccherinum ochraceum TaxID=92696 RepID=A0A4V2MW49_9APHY|nr:hypothetical protein EIP91_003533 [Steccherinum ochraceum]
MRQSILPGRQSQLPSHPANAALAAKLLEKKKETEAIMALEKASGRFLERMEDLANDFDVIADAGKVHGEVLEQWPNMFRILGLFLASRQRQAESDEQSSEQSGERLVRVPIEDLRDTRPSSSS